MVKTLLVLHHYKMDKLLGQVLLWCKFSQPRNLCLLIEQLAHARKQENVRTIRIPSAERVL
jgi:hypothetical protein